MKMIEVFIEPIGLLSCDVTDLHPHMKPRVCYFLTAVIRGD